METINEQLYEYIFNKCFKFKEIKNEELKKIYILYCIELKETKFDYINMIEYMIDNEYIKGFEKLYKNDTEKFKEIFTYYYDINTTLANKQKYKIVMWFYNKFSLNEFNIMYYTPFITNKLANENKINLIKKIYKKYEKEKKIKDYKLEKFTIESLCKNKNYNMVKWFYKKSVKDGFKFKYYDLAYLFKDGNLEMIKWFYELYIDRKIREFKIKNRHAQFSLNEAIKNGHLDIVKWIYEKSKLDGIYRIDFEFTEWIVYSNLNMFKWFYENNIIFPKYQYANKCLEITKWFYENNLPSLKFSNKITKLEIVKWFYEKSLTDTRITVDFGGNFILEICYNKDFDTLYWLLENNISDIYKSCIDFILSTVCFNGRLDIIKWFYYRNYIDIDIDKEINNSLKQSAIKGHFNILKWCDEKNIIDNYEEIVSGAAYGNIDILDWVWEKYKNNEKEFPTKHILENAMSWCNLNVIKWFYEKATMFDLNFYYTTDDIVNVAMNNSIDIIEWLYDVFGEIKYDSEKTINGALKYGCVEILKFFYYKYDECKYNKYSLAETYSYNIELKYWLYIEFGYKEETNFYKINYRNEEKKYFLMNDKTTWDNDGDNDNETE